MEADFKICNRNGSAGENCRFHMDFDNGNTVIGGTNAAVHLGSRLNVIGNMTVGGTWAAWGGTVAAPANSLIVEGMIGAGVQVPATALDVNGSISLRGTTPPALSPASQGRIYFDSVSNTFKASANGGAYQDLTFGGVMNGGNAYGADMTIGTNDSQSLSLKTDNSAKLTILPNGNVGIGENSPSSLLTIKRTLNTQNILSANALSTGTGDPGDFISYKNSLNNNLFLVSGSGAVTANGGVTSSESAGYSLNGSWGQWRANSGRTILSTSYGLQLMNHSTNFVNNTFPSGGSFFDIRPTILQSGAVSYTGINLDVTENTIGTNQNYLMNLKVGGSSQFAVTNTGSVGIGTISLGGKLTLATSTDQDALRVNMGTNFGNFLTMTGDRGLNYVSHMENYNTGGTVGWKYRVGSADFGTRMTSLGADSGRFDFAGEDNFASPMMSFVTSSSHVGIGTTNPQTKLQVEGVISPATNNLYSLGNSTYRFTEVYATNGVINTSDRREKKQIQDSNLGLEFIQKLRPVSYLWNTGLDSDIHYGLIAQEAEQAVQEVRGDRKPTSIVTRDPQSDRYGVRYSELISPMIKAIQEISKSVEIALARLQELTQEKADQRELVAAQVEIQKLKEENANNEQELHSLKAYLCEKDPQAPFCR